jgi:hypothetical protein
MLQKAFMLLYNINTAVRFCQTFVQILWHTINALADILSEYATKTVLFMDCRRSYRQVGSVQGKKGWIYLSFTHAFLGEPEGNRLFIKMFLKNLCLGKYETAR